MKSNIKSKTQIQTYINHICFVVDKSSSIEYSKLTSEVIKVFDSQIQYLARRSQELNQETRVSVFLFADQTECLVYDIDVLRLPSLAQYYKPYGNTALIDATLRAIEDLNQTPELYGDHAFLVYCLTDGEENRSSNSSTLLTNTIKNLPENWTLAVMVPNQIGVHEAKKFGFPVNNISVWSAVSGGVEKAGETIRKATDAFMSGRSSGLRGTKNLFSLDTSNLNVRTIKNNLDELSPTDYQLLPVHKDSAIKEYVESWTKEPYRVGSGYYMLTKPEKVQGYKQVALQDKKTGKIYSGNHARQLLSLPDHEVKVQPTSHPNFNIFLQSTSLNRKLLKGTQILVMK